MTEYQKRKASSYKVINIKAADYDTLKSFCEANDLMIKDEIAEAIKNHIESNKVALRKQ